ncbi:HisA/HisF-related TIM barrel protein [Streptomyces sp. TRM 70351]|uniref:HisA/HisF-related TIM barrel protein n=1 Tax=Streptomyces sp. TRM 70351 TaxID=3116552 RepID=UPI002E7BCB9C|nr:HisA/HisF-related TIM barrel protein [Streptomyces sp. TRM 70351]MEE1926874.1 HisA/HisF-related TIM barrel protein [Streptomyces sp. TRM 70351]
MTYGSTPPDSRTRWAEAVVPCIDVSAGRATEPAGHPGLRDPLDVVAIARDYARDGAATLFLDVLDPWEDTGYLPGLLHELGKTGLAPFVSVQQGVLTSLTACERLLAAGAAKLSVSTSMAEEPGLVASAATEFGGHRLLGVLNCAADGHGGWRVLVHGGDTPTGLQATDVARRYGELGLAGILANSVDREGTSAGYDLELTGAVGRASGLPVIASGGAGAAEHLAAALDAGVASYVLVNKLVHSGRATIAALAQALHAAGPGEGDGT